jgi:endoglucanase
MIFISWSGFANEGGLTVTGNKILNEKGEELYLRGVAIADPKHLNTKREGENAESIIRRAILAHHANIIRVTVLPQYVNEGYFNEHLDPAIDLITKLGAYAIIDLHYRSNYKSFMLRRRARKSWNRIAARYGYNNKVLFEVFSNPQKPHNWNLFKKKIAWPMIKIIRKYSSNIIIVNSPDNNKFISSAAANPLGGSNIVYAAHLFPNSLKDNKWKEKFNLATSKIPVIVTSWGFDQNSEDPSLHADIKNYAEPLSKWFDEKKVSNIAWVFDNVWSSSVVDKDWNLVFEENSMGKFLESFLKRNLEALPEPSPKPTPEPEPIPEPEPEPVPEPEPEPVPEPGDKVTGWLRVEGNKILDSSGKEIQLKGVNIADPEHLNVKNWERPNVSAESVITRAVKEFNANVIRIPVLPETDGYTGWTKDPETYFKKHLDPAVQTALSLGAYAIVDLHYVVNYLGKEKVTFDFWKYIAPRYKDNPYVIYEIFNEPINPDDWDTWYESIAKPTVDIVREFAPENIIIVGSPYWSSHPQGALLRPIEGKNIVYTAHIYANQVEGGRWSYNRDRYEAVLEKYPLFITEWGFERYGIEGGTQRDYGETIMKWMEEHKISWTAWCFDNRWGPRIFDSNWKLMTGNNGMGDFVKKYMEDNILYVPDLD